MFSEQQYIYTPISSGKINMKDGITNYFESFLTKNSLFINKKALQTSYTPETIPHRENFIDTLAGILAPALRVEKPSNIFVYGKTGTGKTLSLKTTTNKIKEVATRNEIPLETLYVNCKLKGVADTEYRLIAHFARAFGRAIPATGLPTDEVYKSFFEAIDSKKQVIILVLDEIDQLVKKAGDEILYNLTRMNEELKNCQLSVVGISNDLMFANNLDPRVKSSLSEEEIIFPPYNAQQLQSILKDRAKLAFKKGALAEGLIPKCAAYAARDHGDARKALELLRVAGELAERAGLEKVSIDNLDLAENKIENDRMVEIVKIQPKQFQLVMYSIFQLPSNNKDRIFTGEVYELYKDLCHKTGLRPLTQRRVSDIIGELDMLGIVSAKVISKGRYGRTREIGLSLPRSTIPMVLDLLKESLDV